jgi:WD40 repeat protein/serine/threonine protein kinase
VRPVRERTAEAGMEGRLLGDFVVGARLGEGGFGTVYLAQQPRLEREVVVKVLHGRPTGAPLARFLREAQLASRLDHPYAAHVYAFDIERDGTAWIAMERVRGTPLSELLRAQGALPLARLVPLVEKLCEVVHTAHELGIVHRDLKPANVMVVARAGQLLPKLLDLGIAKQKDGAGASRPREAVVGVARGEEARRLASAATIDASTEDEPEAASPGAGVAQAAATGDLTARGSVLGSPHYMAPEQWDDAAFVDGRADIYALAVMCWELLTGQLPFQGASLAALAAAHRHGEPAAWPAHLPPGVGELLRRALAKRREDRPATALALARALRVAEGGGDEAVPLPRLSETIRRVALVDAPQPLAEAVAALDGARHPHQAREALRQVVRVAAHVVGLWALAARAHSAPPGGDEPAVAAGVRRLRQDGLDARGWLELARALCRPFVPVRDAHPLPELVDFCAGEASGPHAPDAFDALLAASEGGASDEDAVRAWLAGALPRLERLLGELAFLGSYPLVVAHRGAHERWTGVRRPVRVPAAVRGELDDDEPVLLDRDGVPLVSLFPFAQVAEPAPGAPPELFLLAGAGRHGARLVALPGALERDDERPWGALVLALRTTLEAEGGEATESRAPWLGLAPFTSADASLYVGREREVEALVNRLRVAPLAAVVGASGAGKSSFVHAGVLPALPPGWSVLTLRPGAAPLAMLGARAGVDVGGAHGADAFAAALRARAAGKPLVLVVDQLEELFTLGAGEPERAQVARALAAAAAEDTVRVVLTLRDDFLARAAALPALGPMLGRALTIVTTPAAEDLRRILVEPARRAGYAFEDDALPAEMVAEVAGAPAALALLSFAATRLWELRDRHFRRLSRKAYVAVGGVVGALARHAEDTLAAMRPHEQRLAREAFRRLVTAEGTRGVLACAELEQVLGGGVEAAAVIERLVEARLVSVGEDDGGERRIEVVHEALLSAWPRLVAWRDEDASSTRLRDQLRAAARQWHERGRQAGLLWRREALAEYRLWRGRSDVALTETEAAFAAASLAEEARGRRVRLALAGVAFVALAAAVVGLWAANQRTSRQRVVAESAEHAASASASALRKTHLAQEQELGRLALLAGDPLRALPYLSEAYSAGVDTPALRLLIARALEESPVATLTHDGWVVGAEVSPDGAKIVTCGADGRMRLWNTAGAKQAEWTGFGEVVWACHFSPDGTRLLAAGSDGTAAVVDVASGTKVASWKADPVKLYAATWSPDGSLVATAGKDGHARLFDAKDGTLRFDLGDGKDGPIRGVTFSRDGSRLLDWCFPGEHTHVWDVRLGKALARLHGHDDEVTGGALDATGRRAFTSSSDGTSRIWDVASGRELLRLDEPGLGPVASIELAPDERTVLTARAGGMARLWDATSGTLLTTLPGQASSLAGAHFSHDGSRVLTFGRDGVARLHDVATGQLLGTLHGHVGTIAAAALDGKDALVVTASYDGTARIWDLADARLTVGAPGLPVHASLTRDGTRLLSAGTTIELWAVTTRERLWQAPNPVEYANAAALSPDGKRFAVAGKESAAILSLDHPEVLQRFALAAPAYALAFSPDGARLALGGGGGVVRVFSVADGRERVHFSPTSAPIRHLAFSPDGTLLAVASRARDARVQLVDSATGTPRPGVSTFDGISSAFDPAGTRLVTAEAATQNVARVRDLSSGRLLATLEGHADELTSADFLADGRFVVTASLDGTVRVWDAESGVLLVTIASGLGTVNVEVARTQGRIVYYGQDGRASVSELPGQPPDAAAVAATTRCKSPYRIVDDHLVPGRPDVTACTSTAGSMHQ